MKLRAAASDHGVAPPQWCFLAQLVYYRRFTWVCALGALGLVLARASEMPLPPCPLQAWTGRPCPTCGLTHSAESLLRGDWPGAVKFHLFGPLLAVLAGLALIGSMLPAVPRRGFITWLTHWESRTRSGWILLGTFVIYAFVRLVR